MIERAFQASFLAAMAACGCGGSDSEAASKEAGAAAPDGGSEPGASGSDASGGASGEPTMTFFVTSEGSGERGGDFGGLEGADAFCEERASAAGAVSRTWRAYLCTSGVDARDRIGPGPWRNSAGDEVAASVEALHSDGISNGEPQHILDENGEPVPSVEHDIVTGCEPNGTVRADATCGDWTSSSADDVAMVGHSEIPQQMQFSSITSWNSAHTSAGCDERGLRLYLGAGRIYCFAADSP